MDDKMKNFENPVLVIVVRDDLDSMSPGRAIAQGSHATSEFHEHMFRLEDGQHDAKALFKKWQDGLDFGTTLVFQANAKKMSKVYLAAVESEVPAYGETIDPTYSVRDGSTTHKLSVQTCAWFFTGRKQAEMLTRDLSLFGSTRPERV